MSSLVFNPITNIEITNACNLKCKGCRRPDEHGISLSYMDKDTYTQIISRLLMSYPQVWRLRLHWRGESTLSNNLPEYAQIAHDLGFWTYLSTNMATKNITSKEYMSKLLDNLDQLEVCVDGIDQDNMSKYRTGIRYTQVMKGLRVLKDINTTCKKEMRVLMFRYNEDHIEQFRELANEYDCDLVFGVPIILGKTVLTMSEADEWLAEGPQFQRYYYSQERSGKWVHKTLGTCRPHPVIDVNGNIHPCGLDFHDEHTLGNILRDKPEIIQDALDELLPQMQRRELGMCQNYCFCPAACSVKVQGGES